MCFINKLNNSKKVYFILIIFFLIYNSFFFSKSHSANFKIYDIEIHEEFDLKFKKTKVFEKAFRVAFDQLVSMVATHDAKKKIKNVKISTIKSLIDSFEVSDEKFIEDKYTAKFNVNFNKKNTLNFFEKKNIFPSVPKKLDVLIIPILIDSDKEKLMIFKENPIYNYWNINDRNYYLLNYVLPEEDIEDRKFFEQNLNYIEEYNFKDIIQKYGMSNYIINIIYKDKQILKILSKVKFNEDLEIINQSFEDINLNEENSLLKLLERLKITYEDSWKKLNIINTSIKLSFTVLMSSKDNKKILRFEETLQELDLVSEYNVISFNSIETTYKIVYNGSPKKFISEIRKNNFIIDKENQNWRVK